VTAVHLDAGAVIDTRVEGSKTSKSCFRSAADHAGSRPSRKASGFDLEAFKATRLANGETEPSIASNDQHDDASAKNEQPGGNGPGLALQSHPSEGILHRLQVALLPHAASVTPALLTPEEEAAPDVEQGHSPAERSAQKGIASALPQLGVMTVHEPNGLLTDGIVRAPADRAVLSLATWSREGSGDDGAGYLARKSEIPVGQVRATTGEQPATVTEPSVGSAAVLAGEWPVAPTPNHLRQTATSDPQPYLRTDTISALPHRTSSDLTSLRMSLSPSDLGTVDMVVRRRGSKLEIRLITETDGAAQAITGGRASLDAALAGQGLGMTVSNVEVVSRADAPAHEQSPADTMLHPEPGSGGGRDRQKSHEGSGSAVERQPQPESRALQVRNGAEHDTEILQERGRASIGSWRIV